MVTLISKIGAKSINILNIFGEILIFGFTAILRSLYPPFYLKNILKQFIEAFFYSLPVVGLTAIFAGMVLTLQSYTGFTNLSSEATIANIVVVSITRELGPVLSSLIVAGRMASSIAAEIGTMRVTEQIYALETLQTDSIKYLVSPRIIALMIAMPMIVAVTNILGIMGSFLVAVFELNFNKVLYLQNTWEFLSLNDFSNGLFKGLIFGLIIGLMGSFFGYNTKEGAMGVGKAATFAVVSASILIFVFDYLITYLFFGL